jgi:hypothetical protein
MSGLVAQWHRRTSFFVFLGTVVFTEKKAGKVHDDASNEVLACAAERQPGQRQSP